MILNQLGFGRKVSYTELPMRFNVVMDREVCGESGFGMQTYEMDPLYGIDDIVWSGLGTKRAEADGFTRFDTLEEIYMLSKMSRLALFYMDSCSFPPGYRLVWHVRITSEYLRSGRVVLRQVIEV